MAMVRLDKVQATYSGNIENVKHSADLKNGAVINLGTLDSSGDLYNVATPATASLGSEEILFVASPEVMYDERLNKVSDFVIKAGTAARAYHLTEGDTITVTLDQLSGTPAIGKYLVPANASLKLAVADDLSGNTRFAAKIVEKTTLGYAQEEAWVFRVVKV